MKILSRNQIRAAEESAVKNGIFSLSELMYNAGTRAAELIGEKYDVLCKKAVIVCGNGNNGGDGLVIAAALSNMGADVSLVFPYGLPQTETAKPYLKNVEGIKVLEEIPNRCDFLIDAVFGIGLNRQLSGSGITLVDSMNLCSAIKIAIDVPSGIDCEGSAPSKAFRADLTITFIALKPCFMLPQTSDYCGEVKVVDIGVPITDYSYLTIGEPQTRNRTKNCHKGSFGTALILAGSYGMCGAEILASRAALTTGVGLLKAFVCDKNYTAFCVSVPEAVTIPVSTSLNGAPDIYDKQIHSALTNSDALLIGPGLGRTDEAASIVKKLLEITEIPVVIDADGINCISGDINILRKIKAPAIITPHPAEMARLCHTTVSDIQGNRVQYAKHVASRYSCVVVLKGANTVVASPDGRVFFNTTGNPALATAGSGDVLSGMIVSYLAQGESVLNAALTAVWLHGKAADEAVKSISVPAISPQDIIAELKRLAV